MTRQVSNWYTIVTLDKDFNDLDAVLKALQIEKSSIAPYADARHALISAQSKAHFWAASESGEIKRWLDYSWREGFASMTNQPEAGDRVVYKN